MIARHTSRLLTTGTLLWTVGLGCADEQPPLEPHTTDCTPLDQAPRRLWRLSAQQYGNSVRDMLGLDHAPILSNNGGTAEYAFFSDETAGIDSNFQFSIFQTVEKALVEIAPRIPQLAACNNGEADADCARRFAQSFGSRAFRRPLADDEVTALLGPFNEGAAQDFNTGVSLMIEAVLQSPSFVFRTELGAPEAAGQMETTLTPYEVASQLSFLFRDSIPDAPLVAAAANGSLGTSNGVAQQVDRLLKLPEVRQNLNRIVGEWFNVRQVYSKTKGDDFLVALPETDRDQGAIQSDLYTSATMFIDGTLWSGSRRLTDLLSSPKVYVNQRLATLYGYPFTGPADQFTAVTPPDGMHAGMLTQPAVLWGLSNPTNTSIVKRGRFVHDDVLCEDPAPSPGALLSDPAIQAKLAMLPTEIDKSDYRMMTDPCRGCHVLIDPYARVLESFGPIGEYRTIADDVPVDPTADFTNSSLPPGTITGPPAFVRAVNSNKLLTHCAVQKMTSYALGRVIRVNQTCEVMNVHDQFQRTDGSLTALFKTVATAAFLRQRLGGAQ